MSYHSVDLVHSTCEVCSLKASCAEAFQNTAIVDAIVEVITLDFYWFNRQITTSHQHCTLCNVRSLASHNVISS